MQSSTSKKREKRRKTHDQVIVTRVKNYLAENVDQTFVDVSQMARSLKVRYREYSNKTDSAFCQMVEAAYKVVLRSYGLEGATTSEGSEEESDLELLDENSSTLNERLLALYNIQDKNKRPATSTLQSTAAPDEPIDVLSSDEDGAKVPKIPKISDQITITPHTSTSKTAGGEPYIKTQEKVDIKKKKPAGVKPMMIASKTMYELGSSEVRANFEQVGGLSTIVNQICDLILHMKHPEVYKHLGIKSPRGALLHGPPGTGKTLIAHAIAGKLKLPFVGISGTELVGGVSGESEGKIRDLFARAVSVAPSVLFIDEIDAICGNRANAQKDMEKRMVAQLLESLDALSYEPEQVLVLAATNNPDSLDPSLRRAGRLEQELALGIPSLQTRKEILLILCKGLKLNEDVDFDALAQITPGFVGADLQALVNKACTLSVKRAFIYLNKRDEESKECEKAAKEVENPAPNTEVVTSGDASTFTVQSDTETAVQNVCTEDGSDAGPDSAVIPNGVEKEPSTIAKVNPKYAPTPCEEIYNLLDKDLPHQMSDLSILTIKHQDFIDALKTTKPCSIREGIVTVPDVTWDDVGSLKQVRKDLQLAVLAPVKYPELLKKLGLSVPSGVLLCGPPGCGKTLLAKAVANEAGVNFISVKGPELLNMYVGESERAVRTCFRRARNSAPCVIFFDEFDALCPRRSQQDNNGAARVVNQLLTEMDGIESREGVFVLAASNRPDIIDPAVLRPGRLDRIMYVGMPGIDDREEILKKLTKNGAQPKLNGDVDLGIVAGYTVGYTGADLAGLVRAAAMLALTEHIAKGKIDEDVMVTFANFREALDKCKPSVSAKEQQHYEKLRVKYTSGMYDKDVDMETEGTEESMDTIEESNEVV